MRRASGTAAGIAVLLATTSSSDARRMPEHTYFQRLVAAAQDTVVAVVAARKPALVPPVPVVVAWKPVRLGSLDLGAPLVALTAVDLDGDKKAELYAVTSREVVAIGFDKKLKILSRTPYTGEPSAQVPRDLVGTAAVDGAELVAKCSGWASELRIRWNAGPPPALVGLPRDATNGSLVCPGERLVPVPGRNHFGDIARPIHEVRCRTDLVDKTGAPLFLRAELGAKLTVTMKGLAPDAVPTTFELGEYGTAFALGDVDRDGSPEIAVTGAGAPGDPDAVKVLTLGGDEKKGLFRKVFQGGVAGVAIADGDGDGITEVIAVVRLAGAPRIDVWRLD